MFELRIMVEDKKLVSALKALEGKGHNLEVIPVTNAVVRKGKVREAGHITAAQFIAEWCAKQPKGAVLALRDIKAAAKALGYTDSAIYNGMYTAAKRKAIKKLGEGKYQALAPTKE